jgi:hypothetical protein
MKTYDPNTHGVVVAMRIFYAENGSTPMAELVFAFGRSKTIKWNVVEERETYLPGINAYTLIYDERPKREFNEWKHPSEFQMMADAVKIGKDLWGF